MRILAVISGEYGARHVANLRLNNPENWQIFTWQSPSILPPIVDYPEDYLPTDLPLVDLILAFGEHKGIAELLPDIARMTGAKAVIAPVDNENWLPRGLARQLREWLGRIGVTCVTPKPLCSLTEQEYLITRRKREPYQDPWIAAFAHYFGQPELELTIDPQTRNVASVEVKRDAVCGCAKFVAQALIGLHVEEAVEKAGLAHHHFPCLASMGIDPDFGDTLMHISGNIIKDNIQEQVKPFTSIQYIMPGKHSDS
jgi:hypothetical protein